MENQKIPSGPMTKQAAPQMVEIKGRCDRDSHYELTIVAFGGLSSKHLRNVIRQLEIQAGFLAEDEAEEILRSADDTPHRPISKIVRHLGMMLP